MPRRCTVCTHPERDAINQALVVGESYRSIAQHYEASPPAVYRHWQDHIPMSLAKAQEASEVAQADNLLDQVRELQGRALAILGKAAAGDLRTALGAIREARGNLELLAKLLGELQDNHTVNVLVAPQWVSLRTTILAALGSYPEARQSVVEALHGHPGS